MDLQTFREKNKNYVIMDISDNQFKKYGRIIDEYDFSECIKYMQDVIPKTLGATIYEPSDATMEKMEVAKSVEKNFFGNMPIQIGYCNGDNIALNAVEYHKSSEINIAITDLVVMLGFEYDIVENTYDASNIEMFYVPAGTAFELFSTSLHYAPCAVDKDGFKNIVILPKGTNYDLGYKPEKNSDEQALLFMSNKWLIAHEEAKIEIANGAVCGIKGDNPKLTI